MGGRLWLAAAIWVLGVTSAEACRVPNDPEAARLQRRQQNQASAARADVIVKGIRFERPKSCDSQQYCGEWIRPVQVTKGARAPYYLLDTETMLLVCSREYVKPGKVGTFHLVRQSAGTYLILDDIK